MLLTTSGTALAAHVRTYAGPAGAALVAPDNTFNSVACFDASDCTAVGSSGTNDINYSSLAEHWNGSTWTETTPAPSGGAASSLTGVACTNPTACWAVGYYATLSYADFVLAEHWDGVNWQAGELPDPSADLDVLNGIACVSAAACWAVGSAAEAPLVERWSESNEGPKWLVETTPSPPAATRTYLRSVACTDNVNCTAVGYDDNSSDVGATLAEHWNGAKWSLMVTRNPAAAHGSYLTSVACTGPSSCNAVGYYGNISSTYSTLAEHWNGSKWTLVAALSAAGAGVSDLNSLACTSSANCNAVGYASASTGISTVAEHWNGTKWALVPTPKIAGVTKAELNGVSCANASSCIAVGYYNNTAATTLVLAERWNGTKWAVMSTPNP
jgi:hypothetical protein